MGRYTAKEMDRCAELDCAQNLCCIYEIRAGFLMIYLHASTLFGWRDVLSDVVALDLQLVFTMFQQLCTGADQLTASLIANI